MTLATDKIWF